MNFVKMMLMGLVTCRRHVDIYIYNTWSVDGLILGGPRLCLGGRSPIIYREVCYAEPKVMFNLI